MSDSASGGSLTLSARSVLDTAVSEEQEELARFVRDLYQDEEAEDVVGGWARGP